jgi:hypothetical protein
MLNQLNPIYSITPYSFKGVITPGVNKTAFHDSIALFLIKHHATLVYRESDILYMLY